MRRQCGLNAAETGHLGKDFRTRCALGSGWRSRVCIWLVFPVEEAGGSQSSCVHEKYLKTLLKTQFSWPRLQRSRISRSAMDPRMLILKWAHQVIRHRQSSGALWDGLRSLLRKCLLTYWQVWWSSVGGKMETNVLKITYLHSVHAIALSLLALDQGAPVVQIFFQIKNTIKADCSAEKALVGSGVFSLTGNFLVNMQADAYIKLRLQKWNVSCTFYPQRTHSM